MNITIAGVEKSIGTVASDVSVVLPQIKALLLFAAPFLGPAAVGYTNATITLIETLTDPATMGDVEKVIADFEAVMGKIQGQINPGSASNP